MKTKKFISKKIVVILALAVSAIVFLPAALFAQGAVVGYAYGLHTVSDAQLDRLTHLVAVDLYVNADGTLRQNTDFDSNGYPNGTWANNWLSPLVTKARAKGVKVSIMLSQQSGTLNFASATTNVSPTFNRNRLVNEIVTFVNARNLDGVDLDWEFPGKNLDGTPALTPQQKIQEWNNYIALVNALKTALPGKRISVALSSEPVGAWMYPDQSVQVGMLNSNADAFHIMTYDRCDWNNPHSHANNANAVMTYWAGLNQSKKGKLHTGCAFYGYNTTICKDWNIKTMVNYSAYSAGGFTGSRGDLPADVQNKVNNSYTQGYGGVFIWLIGQDANTTTTPTLLHAIWGASNIAITTQPAPITNVTQGCITGSLSVVAAKRSSGIANFTYQWYSNTTDSNTGGTPITTGGTNASFTIPAGLAPGTHHYFCEVRSGSVIALRTNVAKVVVVQLVTGTITPATQTICTGNSVALTHTGAASCVTKRQWQEYKNNAWGDIPNATGTTYNTGALTNTGSSNITYRYRVKLNGQNIYSAESVITVQPVVPGTITPASQTICTGNSVALTHSGFSCVTSRQWQLSTNNGTSWTDISGATGTSYNTGTLTNTGTSNITYKYRVKLNGQNIYSAESVITVTPAPIITITTHPSNITVQCSSGTLSVGATVTQGASLSYQWYSNTSNNNTGGTAISSAKSASYSIPSGFKAGTYYYYCEVSATGGAVSKNSNVATVTVSAGLPVITSINGPTSAPCYQHVRYSATYDNNSNPNPNNSGDWEWQVPGNGGFMYNWGANMDVSFTPGWYQVVVRAKNPCGWSEYKVISVEASNRSSGHKIYPNPVSNILYIEIEPAVSGKTQVTFDVRLYDGKGNVLRQQKTNGGTVEFNVANLPVGTYYIHIYDGENVKPEIYQVSIER